MLEFILDRYNYWIVIVLMMMGLYIVISRGNLVKKIIGLNVFQTSVFIFYISIGKITGGTAPILIGGHGGGHDAPHDEPAGASGDHGAVDAAHAEQPDASLHEGLGANPVDVMAERAVEEAADDLHHAEAANDTLSAQENTSGSAQENTSGFEIEPVDAADPGAQAGEAAHAVADVIYTNPLPHVLILTAIVVGVATTAVGLALAVRIREAYGTIEEDELEAVDNIAEFGDQGEAPA